MINAIYARQSLFKQDSVSIEAQIDMCRKFTNPGDEVEIYHDAGWSGKNIARPEMTRLISNIKEGKVNKVIAYRLDRISRNIVDFGNLLQLFEKHNVVFTSATEDIRTDSPMARAMLYIVATFASLERETIALRVLDSYKFRASSGISFMGGNVPYGYYSKKELVGDKKVPVLKIEDKTAELVKTIFKQFTDGASLYSLVKHLNTTQKDREFTAEALKRILSNITYCTADDVIYLYLKSKKYQIINPEDEFIGQFGMCMYMKNKNRNQTTEIKDRICVIGMHEPLVSSDTWIKAQYLLEQTRAKASPKRSKISPFAGLLKCKECGGSFGLKVSRNYKYYVCRQRLSKGGLCDNKLALRAEPFEEKLVDAVFDYINSLNLVARDTTTTTVDSIKVNTLQEEINNLIDNIGKGNAVVDELLNNKIIELQKAQEKITLDMKSIVMQNQLNVEQEDYKDMTIDDKINVMRQAVERVDIDKHENVEIYYKI